MKTKPSIQLLKKTKQPREAACIITFLALFEDFYASNLIDLWMSHVKPPALDYKLCKQLCLGTIQRKLTLEFVSKNLASDKKLKLKRIEKTILYLSLFQKLYLEKIPLYAITSEGKKLIRLFASEHFSRFFSACLHKADLSTLSNMKNSSRIKDMSLLYSFPEEFIKQLINKYGETQTQTILLSLNSPAKTHVRYRLKNQALKNYPPIIEKPFWTFEIPEANKPSDFLNKNFYIQNATTVDLTTSLASHITLPPAAILDLCAAPGGKSFILHDLFPSSELYMNDIDEHKLSIIKENLKRLEIDAHTTEGLAQDFPIGKLFDLVVLDVPCSNSGVLNKRPEARWRFTDPQNLLSLKQLQQQILQHATQLVSSNGYILFMTCSILEGENEQAVKALLKECSNFKLLEQKTLLPNEQGLDGGFAALIQKQA
ncbi:MAG: methyltransferase domain-containing protein [Chlamydiales bacterium]|nr:methyltransferase domain-containing protein [Chlamydiales bacterium]NCF71539.1 methyltransferase domain-containing protein [Chlamydiales bacterium]